MWITYLNDLEDTNIFLDDNPSFTFAETSQNALVYINLDRRVWSAKKGWSASVLLCSVYIGVKISFGISCLSFVRYYLFSEVDLKFKWKFFMSSFPGSLQIWETWGNDMKEGEPFCRLDSYLWLFINLMYLKHSFVSYDCCSDLKAVYIRGKMFLLFGLKVVANAKLLLSVLAFGDLKF